MKLFESPIASGDLARLLPVFVPSLLPLLLCTVTLTGTMLLTAAPAQPQTLCRPSSFERNRGQAPKEVKWSVHSSRDRALFAGSGATFLHLDEYDARAMAERQPVPVENFQDRRSGHHRQTTPKSRRPLQNLNPVEGTSSIGKRLSSGPQTSSDRIVSPARQIPQIR
jgi:hypothetical protein